MLRRSPFALLAVAIAVIASMAVALASAHQPQPTWPGNELRIHDRSGWDVTVKRAVRQWNAADVGIRLVLVSSAQQADVEIVSDDRRVDGFCADRHCYAFATTIGPKQLQHTTVVLRRPLVGEGDRPNAWSVRVVVHELGHVLGLHHPAADDAACSVMRSDLQVPDCHGPEDGIDAGAGPCGPFAADVRKAARLYGGRGIAQAGCRWRTVTG